MTSAMRRSDNTWKPLLWINYSRYQTAVAFMVVREAITTSHNLLSFQYLPYSRSAASLRAR